MTSNDNIGPECAECPEPLHLILYGPGRDRNTFENAARVLERDYEQNYPQHSVVVAGFMTGEHLVELINSNREGSIISLDVISHGNQSGIHVSESLEPPLESYWAKRNAHVIIRGKSEEEAEYMEESMMGLYSDKPGAIGVSYYYNQKLFKDESTWGRLRGKINIDHMNDGVALLSEVESSRFSNNAFIEFHGCRVAENQPWLNDVRDNFAEQFAEHIGRGSTVIGHIDNNFPDKHPVNANDYRQNKVRVYGNAAWYRLGDASESEAVERWGLTFPNSSTPPR